MNIFKKALIVALSVGLISVPTVTKEVEAASQPSTLFLTPNSNWTQSDAWFAAYFFGNGEKWNRMTDNNSDGIYEVSVPSGYTSVIFCRMNPSSNNLGWTTKWDQTIDLTIPTDGTNHFTVNDGAWNNANGTWSTIEVTEPESYNSEWYLRGSFNEWGVTDKFSTVEGKENTYTLTKKLQKNDTFKISDANFTEEYTIDHTKLDSYSYNFLGADNTEDNNILVNETGTYIFTVDAVTNTFTITFSYDGSRVLNEKVRIYFNNEANWENINLYTWGGSDANSWPGTSIVSNRVNNTNFYYFDTYVGANIIFNDGTNQTPDLVVPANGKNIYSNSSSDNVWYNLSELDAYYQEKASSTTGYSDIRLLSTFEGLTTETLGDYDAVGFVVGMTYNGKTQYTEVTTTSVYSSVEANGESVTATDLNAKSTYLFLIVINEVPAGTKIFVTPFAKSGANVNYGLSKTFEVARV